MDHSKTSGKNGGKTERVRKKRVKHDPQAESARASFGKRKDSPEE